MDFEAPSETNGAAVAILALTRQGVDLALELGRGLPGSLLHVPSRHRFALEQGAMGFERLADVFVEIWHTARAIVCIMATGIVVRHLAPLVQHKTLDPAVVVVDERGRFAISLLSGHLGGANALAVQVARITGGQAVITTASDVEGKPALDLMAREAGLEAENPEMFSRLARAMVEDEPFFLFDPERRLKPQLAEFAQVTRVGAETDLAPEDDASFAIQGPGDLPVPHSGQPSAAGCPVGQVGLWVSERLAPAGCTALLLRPRNLVAGVGCNRGTSAGEILAFIEKVFLRERLSPLSIRNLASVDLKADESGLLEAARVLARPIRFYSRDVLQAIEVPNPSQHVARHIGVPSVCEATALISAQSPTLLIPKQKEGNVTLAVARVGFLS